jgi:hypothetical protein
VYQSSTTCRSVIGTSATTGIGWLSGLSSTATISCQWLWCAPLMNPHLPLTTMPPSAGVALAVGLSVPQTRTSAVENTSSCTSSGNRPAIQVGIEYTDSTHDAEPSPRPSSAATSTNVRVSDSYPP